MKKNLAVALDVVWYLVVFALVQFVVTFAGGLVMLKIKGLPFSGISHLVAANPMLIIVTTILSSLITIALFVWRGWAVQSRKYIQTRPWTTLVWVAIATLGLILPAAGYILRQFRRGRHDSNMYDMKRREYRSSG